MGNLSKENLKGREDARAGLPNRSEELYPLSNNRGKSQREKYNRGYAAEFTKKIQSRSKPTKPKLR